MGSIHRRAEHVVGDALRRVDRSPTPAASERRVLGRTLDSSAKGCARIATARTTPRVAVGQTVYDPHGAGCAKGEMESRLTSVPDGAASVELQEWLSCSYDLTTVDGDQESPLTADQRRCSWADLWAEYGEEGEDQRRSAEGEACHVVGASDLVRTPPNAPCPAASGRLRREIQASSSRSGTGCRC